MLANCLRNSQVTCYVEMKSHVIPADISPALNSPFPVFLYRVEARWEKRSHQGWTPILSGEGRVQGLDFVDMYLHLRFLCPVRWVRSQISRVNVMCSFTCRVGWTGKYRDERCWYGASSETRLILILIVILRHFIFCIDFKFYFLTQRIDEPYHLMTDVQLGSNTGKVVLVIKEKLHSINEKLASSLIFRNKILLRKSYPV